MEDLFKKILELYGMDIESTDMESFRKVLEASGLEIITDIDGNLEIVSKGETYETIIEEEKIKEEIIKAREEIINEEIIIKAESLDQEKTKENIFQNEFLNSNKLGLELEGLSLEEILEITEQYEMVDMLVTEEGEIKTIPKPERAGKIAIQEILVKQKAKEELQKIKKEEEYRELQEKQEKEERRKRLENIKTDLEQEAAAVLREASLSSLLLYEAKKTIDAKTLEKENDIEELSKWLKNKGDALNNLIDMFYKKMENNFA